MALGTFTVGRDAQAVAISATGVRLELAGLTDFTWTPQYSRPRSEPLNGPPIERYLPHGHTLKFSIDRRGPDNERLFALIEIGWWTVGSADLGTSAGGVVYFYVNETDGGQSTYQFTGVSLGLTQGGDFRTDNAVKQTIEGHAQRMFVL